MKFPQVERALKQRTSTRSRCREEKGWAGSDRAGFPAQLREISERRMVARGENVAKRRHPWLLAVYCVLGLPVAELAFNK